MTSPAIAVPSGLGPSVAKAGTIGEAAARRTIRHRPLGLNDVQSGKEGCTHTATIDLLVAQQRGAAPRRPSAAAIERPEGPGFPRMRVHANLRRRPDPRPRFHAPGGLSARIGRARNSPKPRLGACTPQLTVGPMQKYQATPAALPDSRTTGRVAARSAMVRDFCSSAGDEQRSSREHMPGWAT